MTFPLLFLLTGCGVAVEVVTPAAPTPTAYPFPYYQYSSDGVYRALAYPRIAFGTDGGVDTAAFALAPAPPALFMLQYHPIWLNAEYEALWYGEPLGSARVRVNALTRPSPDAPWQPVEANETAITTDVESSRTNGSTGVTVYTEAPGYFQVRAETTIFSYPPQGEIEQADSQVEFDVYVLNDPGEIETDAEALTPAVGNIDVGQLILDWRGWRSPCDLAEEAEAGETGDLLMAACSAFLEENYESVLELLAETDCEVETNSLSQGICAAAGYIAYAFNAYDEATQAFTGAILWSATSSDALAVGIHLHNLAAAHLMKERDAEAYVALQQLEELRRQYYDEAGIELTQANAGYANGERWRVEDTHWWLDSIGSPLTEVTGAWMEQME